eukprot:1220690-Alexandrium_andersonii.AAC.1
MRMKGRHAGTQLRHVERLPVLLGRRRVAAQKPRHRQATQAHVGMIVGGDTVSGAVTQNGKQRRTR